MFISADVTNNYRMGPSVEIYRRANVVSSDDGPVAYRELDDAVALRAMTVETLAGACTGKDDRQSVRASFRECQLIWLNDAAVARRNARLVLI